MKQYCRYCAFCFEADDFRCMNHPNGEEPHWTRTQINRENHCPNFVLSDLGDVETGKPYKPIAARKKPMPKPDYEQLDIRSFLSKNTI